MRRGTFAAAVLAVLAFTTASVAAAPPTGGHGDSTPQATDQFATSGPATAGLAYAVSLGIVLDNQPDSAILTGNGLAAYQGRATSDLPGTAENEAADPRDVLVAVDPEDGSVAWTAPDINRACVAAATSDGRIIAQLDEQSPTNPDLDKSLVAIDEDTGELIPGQVYDGEVLDDARLEVCERRLLLSDDETLALVLGNFDFSTKIRAIDIDPGSPTAFRQVWQHDLRDAGDDGTPAHLPTLVAAQDGSGFYLVYRSDPDASPTVWQLKKFDWNGNVIATADLPGRESAFTTDTFVATDGGVVLALDGCAGNPNPTDECVVFHDDEGTSLSQRWIAYEPDTGGNNFFQGLSRADGDTLVGFSEISSAGDVSAIDVDTGAVEWSVPVGDSNNGGQLVTDAAGNAYFATFGDRHLWSFSPDGSLRWDIPSCHLDATEPTVLGPIAPDGTLLTLAAPGGEEDVVRGFRTGESLPVGSCTTTRVAGLSRVETAVDISQRSFEANGSADTVVIATAFNYPDALAGGPLARSLDAPLLLTAPDALSFATRDEIERLGATKAVVLGGAASLSRVVVDELERDLGLVVERIAGDNRFDTAALIADRVGGTTVYVTEGANADPNRGWPDAVAVSGLAALEQRPILLVTRDVLPQETRDAVVDLGVTHAVVVGGTGSVSDAVAGVLADPDGDGTDDVTVTRVAGASRFATSVEIAKRSVAAGASTLDLWFATGLAFPDALAAGPAVGRAGGVLLLVHGQDPNGGPEVYDWLDTLSDDQTLRGTMVGGEAAITTDVAEKLADVAGIG